MLFAPTSIVIDDDLDDSVIMRRIGGPEKTTDDDLLIMVAEADPPVATAKPLIDKTRPGFSRANVYTAIARLRKAGLLIDGTPW